MARRQPDGIRENERSHILYLDFGNDQELNSSVQRRQTVP